MHQLQCVFILVLFHSLLWNVDATTHPNLIHKQSVLRTNDFKTYIPNLAIDSQNRIITSGYNKEPQIFTSPFVCKYDENYRQLWNTTLSNSIGERILMKLDAQDNIYVAGYFGLMKKSIVIPASPKNESFQIITTLGENDIFVLKLDSSGNLLWATSIGTEADELLGNFYVSEKGTIGIVGVRNYHEWFITRLNADGSIAWEKPMGTSGGWHSNNNFGIAVDASDNLVVAHSYTEPTILNNQHLPFKENHQHNGLVIKFDTTGEIVWFQTWNLPELKDSKFLISREFTGMEVDKEGNIYATGKDSTNVPLGAFVLKVTSNGQKSWEVKLEGWVEDIFLGDDGKLYAIGSYSESYPETVVWGVSLPTLPPARRSSAFVVKLSTAGKMNSVMTDGTGKILWKNAWTGSKWISGNSIALTEDQKIVISFGFSNEANFGGETFKTKQSKDINYVSAVLATYVQNDNNLKEEL